MYNRHPRNAIDHELANSSIDPASPIDDEDRKDTLVKQVIELREHNKAKATENILKAQARQKKYYDVKSDGPMSSTPCHDCTPQLSPSRKRGPSKRATLDHRKRRKTTNIVPSLNDMDIEDLQSGRMLNANHIQLVSCSVSNSLICMVCNHQLLARF